MESVRGRLIYTGKEIVKDAFVVFQGQKIVGLAKQPRGEVTVEAEVVTPAFIDAHSHIGMHRAGEPGAESESNEKYDSFTTAAEALDSVQMDDASFALSLRAGVLYSCVLPGSGNIIGGRGAVIRNYGKTTNAAVICRAGLKGAFGYNPMSTREWKGVRPWTRMGALALLRTKLSAVNAKLRKLKRTPNNKKAEVEFSLEEQLLRALLERREILRAHVHKADDIDALIRLAAEYDFRFTVEHTMDVHDKSVFENLKKHGVTVIYGPLDSMPYKVELKHEDPLNVRHLVESGVDFGLMTDHPVIMQNTLLLTLRWFLAAGLTKQAALELITRRNAKILRVDDKLGTLEKGKWASFVCWNGDPFDLAYGNPAEVFAEGRRLPMSK